MDILLIDPPYRSLKGIELDCGYNVGLTSLAAYIRSMEIETAVLTCDLLVDFPPKRIWDNPAFKDNAFGGLKKYALGHRELIRALENDGHHIWGKIANSVRQTSPKVVGIPYMSPVKYVVEKIVNIVKEVDGDIKIVAGHAHPTFYPEEVMQNPAIDFVIGGEGEIPLLKLVEELKKDNPKLETVPGIYYRDREGQVRSNKGIDFIGNLDELPFLARDLVLGCDYDSYREHNIYTNRGCPYTCTFCADRRLWGGKVRRRSIENVIEEIIQINDTFKVDLLAIIDGTFTYDRQYLEAFCNKLIDLQLNIRWGCTARHDNLDKEILKLMKRAKCRGLYFGMESGSDRILKAINKKITIEDTIRVSKMTRDAGIISINSIIMGLPYETKEDMEETLELMQKVKTDFIDINSYIPLPGTPMYDSMCKEDQEKIDWRKVSLKSLDNHFSETMSHDEFNTYLLEAYKLADSINRKSTIRLGIKMIPEFATGILKKLWK